MAFLVDPIHVGAGVVLAVAAALVPVGPVHAAARWATLVLAVPPLVGGAVGLAATLAVAPVVYGGVVLVGAFGLDGDDGARGVRGVGPRAFVAGVAALGTGAVLTALAPIGWLLYAGLAGPSLLWPWTAAPGGALTALGATSVLAARRRAVAPIGGTCRCPSR